MSEPTACDRARTCPDPSYCERCDVLVGLEGFHVLAVDQQRRRLQVVIESAPGVTGCRSCGVIAHSHSDSHGRRDVVLIDVPCFGRPVELVWRKRTWRCVEPRCAVGSWTEQHDDLAQPRALLTTRACWWAISQIRREHASVAGIARQLGASWRTVWRSIEPLLQAMADDPTRFAGVTTLGRR
jgi:transposase